MIKAVLFDFGGVLATSGKQGFIARVIADLYDQPVETIDIGDLHAKLRRGQCTTQDFLRELNSRFGGKVTEQMFVDAVHATSSAAPEVYALAEDLRSNGIKTGIFSNVFGVNAAKLQKEGWYEGFDPILLSCDEGYAKPDPEFYERAVEKLNLLPEEILLIDDQEKCMPPAKHLGMHTILAESPAQIVADTKALIRRLNRITV